MAEKFLWLSEISIWTWKQIHNTLLHIFMVYISTNWFKPNLHIGWTVRWINYKPLKHTWVTQIIHKIQPVCYFSWKLWSHHAKSIFSVFKSNTWDALCWVFFTAFHLDIINEPHSMFWLIQMNNLLGFSLGGPIIYLKNKQAPIFLCHKGMKYLNFCYGWFLVNKISKLPSNTPKVIHVLSMSMAIKKYHHNIPQRVFINFAMILTQLRFLFTCAVANIFIRLTWIVFSILLNTKTYYNYHLGCITSYRACKHSKNLLQINHTTNISKSLRRYSWYNDLGINYEKELTCNILSGSGHTSNLECNYIVSWGCGASRDREYYNPQHNIMGLDI